ncbi:M20/M25/M40 family metallo-hydrolase [Dysosmobacter sp.]|uniref:M20/M25/M40 family metallo-hydrolase n=1 Tax=Dysosmobacter sp. TaxID=2591382 RepID=UPI002A8FB4FC|nr:M20/M25/M40 family metallo-hydrolase [Dysosmobacter sp.]MDY3985727.1 M20/M25/M40 family metallo-hydrolase [Dysosmobacter sp.]
MKRMLAAVLALLLLVTPAFAAGESGRALTREEAVEALYEAAGKPETAGTQRFADVAEEEAAVAWAAEQGIVQGVGGGRFAPDAAVTRQAFAGMLYRYAGSPAVSGAELAEYPDGDRAAGWAKDALLWCVKTGVLPAGSEEGLNPTGTVTETEARAALERLADLPDISVLKQDLETLTAVHRPIGSDGERKAAQYLQRRFREMGYQVTTQTYTDDAGRKGTNVIAARSASGPDADILVFSAHHDSVPTAYGANDNASGVVALLAVAEALKDVPTDTELRFISFTDEENGKNGSRYYTASLTEKERSRMIGDIQLDMLGGLGSGGMSVCTMDGEANWLSDLLREKSGARLEAETASDHASFQLAEVPSVLVMQSGRGYLYHSAADVADQIDLYRVAGAATAVTALGREVADPQTSGYRQVARAQGEGYTFRQTRQNVIYFSSSLKDTEAYIGAAGTLTDHREQEGNGWKDVYDTYRYSMRWFGGETPMSTYYCYRNGFLERIEIRPEETGYTAEQVRSMIRAMYGKPSSSRTDRDGALVEGWADEIYSKYISYKGTEPCVVTVSGYSVGISNVLASYPVTSGQAAVTDPADAKVWDYLCAILPQETRGKIGEFNLFTDGTSNILAYTSPMKHGDGTVDNTRFSINIDYYDVYDENGAPRDWSKLTYTILHEYGHVLLEDETQVDLSVGQSTHDPAGFIPGSFRRAFYDRFWKDLGASGVGDYEKHPTDYVSRYGANYFHEDIADTFAVFVLGGESRGNTVAEEKLRFFWADAEMVALRISIRQSMGLD